MSGGAKATLALEKLLRVARQNRDETTARIGDLETAKASAEASIEWLLQSVREEQAAMARNSALRAGAPNADMALMRFTEAARNRRTTLRDTIETLDAEIETARAALSEAAAEVKKLEHLLHAAEAAREKRARRREQDALDDAARRFAPFDAQS